jgi:hypothetical protein
MSNWLSVGSLLALRQSAHEISVVEVIGRDLDTLQKSSARACVKIRFLSPAACQAALQALAGVDAVLLGGQGNHFWAVRATVGLVDEQNRLLPPHGAHVQFQDAVQVSNNFGVSRPVLAALQSSHVANPKIASVLFGGTHDAAQEALGAPPWQDDEGTRQWLQVQVDRMDDAQRAAFNAALVNPVALIQGPPGVSRLSPSLEVRMLWQVACSALLEASMGACAAFGSGALCRHWQDHDRRGGHTRTAHLHQSCSRPVLRGNPGLRLAARAAAAHRRRALSRSASSLPPILRSSVG